MNETIILFVKSMLIGVANIIPGVSGGTVAVLLKVYDEILEKIGNFFEVSMKKKIEYFKYLLIFFIGAVVGILLFANIIKFSITNFPKLTSAVFSLLILPSLYYLLKDMDCKKIKNIISFLVGLFVMGIFIYFNLKYKTIDENTVNIASQNTKDLCFSAAYLIKLFIYGILAAGTMIIPGISGSLLLLILGEYYNIIAYVSDLNIKPLFFLGLGVMLGLVIFSKIISYLLKHYREITMFFIAGIICLSVVQIWINI
ncbi:MAG: DUF368 domain-containing protein [Fusobacterium sp.]|nr:DUF368 domain-containing protein [Fusobacterium sp.]